jgi:hypothetical protein
MEIPSVREAIDLHVHSAPCLFPRIGDDFEIAVKAREAGMQAIVLKSNFESTVGRAYHTMKRVEGIRVFGGLVLNHAAGGINPYAVQMTLRLGGRLIWMPTLDAEFHAKVYGGTGKFFQKTMAVETGAQGINALKDGKLIPEAIEVLEFVKQYDAILATGHLSKEEIRALVEYARVKIGGVKIVITHPEWPAPNLDVQFLEEMTKLGAFVEYVASSIGALNYYAPPEKTKDAIYRLGPESVILSSDCGVIFYPFPSEFLRVFAACLHEVGVELDALRQMMVENPKKLLGL